MTYSFVFIRFHQSYFLHLNYFILLNNLPFIIINNSLLYYSSIIHSTCLDLINLGSLNDLINSSFVEGILDQLHIIIHIIYHTLVYNYQSQNNTFDKVTLKEIEVSKLLLFHLLTRK